MASMVGLRRNRATDIDQAQGGRLADATFDPDDSVSLVVTDLLWLDETSLLDVPLLERRRLLEGVSSSPTSVRIGAFVRPPIQHLGRLVAVAGLRGPDVQGGQQSLPAGRTEPRMGHQRDAAPLRVVRLASCPRPR